MRFLNITSAIATSALIAAAAKEKDARVRKRIKAIRIMLPGKSVPAAALASGLGERQLRRWVHRFNAEGLSGLRDRTHPGKAPKLSSDKAEKFIKKIRKELSRGKRAGTLDVKEIQQILSREFDTNYSLWGIYSLFRRLNIHLLDKHT